MILILCSHVFKIKKLLLSLYLSQLCWTFSEGSAHSHVQSVSTLQGLVSTWDLNKSWKPLFWKTYRPLPWYYVVIWDKEEHRSEYNSHNLNILKAQSFNWALDLNLASLKEFTISSCERTYQIDCIIKRY